MKIISVMFLLILSFMDSKEFSFDGFPEFSIIEKRENGENFEQCSSVNFVMGQLGVVNVVAFLDSSWPYSYKQAKLLKLLKDRLHHSGLPEALFYVITTSSSPNSLDYIPESQIEKEAWQGVAPDEAMDLSSESLTYESLTKMISPDIFLIEDNEELGIWKEMRGSRNQILVIDRCGKLAYQVIVPWSILHFPYVKAAILSTHKDNPCGPCDSYATVVEFDDLVEDPDKIINTDESEEVTDTKPETTTIANHIKLLDSMNPEEEENQQDDDDNSLPGLRIIMHAPHIHLNTDTKRKHEYLVLESDKPNYHGHLDTPNNENNEGEIIIEREFREFLGENVVFGKDESPGLYGEVADFWRDLAEEQMDAVSSEIPEPTEIIKTSTIPDDLMAETVTNPGEFTVEEEESRSKLIAHYSRLLPWIYYALDE